MNFVAIIHHTGLITLEHVYDSDLGDDAIEKIIALSQKVHDHNEKLIQAGGDIFDYVKDNDYAEE